MASEVCRLRHRQRECESSHLCENTGCKSKPMGSNFGVGEFTTHFGLYFSGDWDVHWGYGLLTHGHLPQADLLTFWFPAFGPV